MDSRNYGDWTISRLKDELKRRNAKLSGRKKELVERLEAYDRNFNFGLSCDVPADDFKMDIPCMTEYKDLNRSQQIPLVSIEHVHAYLNRYDKKLGSIAAELYKCQFLRYIRKAAKGDIVFIHNHCRAEMRKRVTYGVDLSISSYGEINEAQCECAVGMGPGAHCNHVDTVLFGLSEFSSGRDIICEQTCTERLQTFHRVKKFSGSPLKINNLSGDSARNSLVYDPRPNKFQKQAGYNSDFRNACVNFAAHGNDDMAILQLYAPANPFGLCHDHDYCKLSLEDILLVVCIWR